MHLLPYAPQSGDRECEGTEWHKCQSCRTYQEQAAGTRLRSLLRADMVMKCGNGSGDSGRVRAHTEVRNSLAV